MTDTSSTPTVALGEIDVEPQEEDERFFSVTTIIGALDKPALLYWSAEETAKLAVVSRSSLTRRVKEEGEEAVIKWLRDARFRPPKGYRSATALGTAVHDAVEQYALTGLRPEVDDEVRPFLEQFDRWAQVWQPKYLAAEAAVYNRTYGYAGTLDAIAEIDGQTVLLDYKSSRKSTGSDGKPSGPYPEVALQLAAYRHAEIVATWRARRFEKYRRRYYLLNEAEAIIGEPMPEVDGCVVLHLTPEHADLYPIRADDAVFEKFLFTLECFGWLQGLSKQVIGKPMERSTR
jgi:AraC-like DNA-binding protein